MIVVSLACAFTWLPWHQTDLKRNTRTFALSHSMHISTRNTGIPRRWTEILEKPCSSVYKVLLTKNSLQIPLVASKEESGRKLIKGDCCTVLLFFKKKKKDPRISWNMYTDKTFWTGVSRYPLLGRDETDSFDLRGGTIMAMYMRKNKTCPANIRRILIVLNNTRTSPYTRHISTKIRRDLAKIALSKNRCYGIFSLICLLRNGQTGPIIEHVYPRGTLALPLGIERSI